LQAGEISEAAPVSVLTIEERQQLTPIVEGLYDVSAGAYARRVLMEQAGLQRFVAGINLDTDSSLFARGLIAKLDDFGVLPERPAYHALGALLSYLLTLGDLPADRAALIARLIVVHELVGDATYIAKLRHDYQIREPRSTTEGPEMRRTLTPSAPEAVEPPIVTDIENEETLEEVLHSEDNFLDIQLLVGALYCATAVCRIESPEWTPRGTGFLIGPDLVMTNQHVLKTAGSLEEAVARFGHVADATTIALPGRTVAFRADFYHSSPADRFDYVLAKLQSAPLGSIAEKPGAGTTMLDMVRSGKHRGYLRLAPRMIKAQDRVNIIQHPHTNPMKVVMTQNYVVEDMSDTRVRYVADTMDGSSGSPVFNQTWEVVALHHGGAPYRPEAGAARSKKEWKGRYRVNVGIPMRGLLRDLRETNRERYLPST
jgi:V8-like Glu-specific endopeptidase